MKKKILTTREKKVVSMKVVQKNANDLKVKYHEYKLAKAKADVNFHEKRLKELQTRKKK